MDPEMKKLLEENLALAKENNEMLRKVRRLQKRGQLFTLFYWLMIIGIPLGLYYFLRPFLDQVINLYTGGTSGYNEVMNFFNSLSDTQTANELLSEIKSLQK